MPSFSQKLSALFGIIGGSAANTKQKQLLGERLWDRRLSNNLHCYNNSFWHLLANFLRIYCCFKDLLEDNSSVSHFKRHSSTGWKRNQSVPENTKHKKPLGERTVYYFHFLSPTSIQKWFWAFASQRFKDLLEYNLCVNHLKWHFSNGWKRNPLGPANTKHKKPLGERTFYYFHSFITYTNTIMVLGIC
jgi:hypothetical protein